MSAYFKKKKIFTLLLIATSFAACRNKEIDPLKSFPAATREGLNTFGCLVDNKPWWPQVASTPDNKMVAAQLMKGGGIIIKAYRSHGMGDGIIGTQNTMAQYIKFDLSKSHYPENSAIRFSLSDKATMNIISTLYTTNATETGSLTFTRFDTVNHVVSGVFSFKARFGEEILNITGGRFDIVYETEK